MGRGFESSGGFNNSQPTGADYLNRFGISQSISQNSGGISQIPEGFQYPNFPTSPTSTTVNFEGLSQEQNNLSGERLAQLAQEVGSDGSVTEKKVLETQGQITEEQNLNNGKPQSWFTKALNSLEVGANEVRKIVEGNNVATLALEIEAKANNSEIIKFNKEIDEKNETGKNLNQELTSVSEDLNEKEEDLVLSKREKSSLNTEKSKKEENISTLEKRLEELKRGKEFGKKEDENGENIDEVISELETEIEEENLLLAEINNKITENEKLIAEKSSEIRELKTQKEELEKQINILKEEIEELKSKIAELEKRNSEIEEQLKEFRELFEKQREEREKIRERLQKEKQRIEAETKAELEEENEIRGKTNETVKEARNLLSDLEVEFKKTQNSTKRKELETLFKNASEKYENIRLSAIAAVKKVVADSSEMRKFIFAEDFRNSYVNSSVEEILNKVNPGEKVTKVEEEIISAENRGFKELISNVKTEILEALGKSENEENNLTAEQKSVIERNLVILKYSPRTAVGNMLAFGLSEEQILQVCMRNGLSSEKAKLFIEEAKLLIIGNKSENINTGTGWRRGNSPLDLIEQSSNLQLIKEGNFREAIHNMVKSGLSAQKIIDLCLNEGMKMHEIQLFLLSAGIKPDELEKLENSESGNEELSEKLKNSLENLLKSGTKQEIEKFIWENFKQKDAILKIIISNFKFVERFVKEDINISESAGICSPEIMNFMEKIRNSYIEALKSQIAINVTNIYIEKIGDSEKLQAIFKTTDPEKIKNHDIIKEITETISELSCGADILQALNAINKKYNIPQFTITDKEKLISILVSKRNLLEGETMVSEQTLVDQIQSETGTDRKTARSFAANMIGKVGEIPKWASAKVVEAASLAQEFFKDFTNYSRGEGEITAFLRKAKDSDDPETDKAIQVLLAGGTMQNGKFEKMSGRQIMDRYVQPALAKSGLKTQEQIQTFNANYEKDNPKIATKTNSSPTYLSSNIVYSSIYPQTNLQNYNNFSIPQTIKLSENSQVSTARISFNGETGTYTITSSISNISSGPQTMQLDPKEAELIFTKKGEIKDEKGLENLLKFQQIMSEIGCQNLFTNRETLLTIFRRSQNGAEIPIDPYDKGGISEIEMNIILSMIGKLVMPEKSVFDKNSLQISMISELRNFSEDTFGRNLMGQRNQSGFQFGKIESVFVANGFMGENGNIDLMRNGWNIMKALNSKS